MSKERLPGTHFVIRHSLFDIRYSLFGQVWLRPTDVVGPPTDVVGPHGVLHGLRLEFWV